MFNFIAKRWPLVITLTAGGTVIFAEDVVLLVQRLFQSILQLAG